MKKPPAGRAGGTSRTRGSPRTRHATGTRHTSWRWALAGIFIAAFAWRLFYLSRLALSPLWGSRVADSQSYWDWATYLLAHGPVGRNPYFLAPLYPHVLAILRLAPGSDPWGVLVAQALWGSLAAVLLADAAMRVSRPALGVAVGLVVAFARMATFFDGLVLAESLLFFLASALVWSVARTIGRAVTLRDALLWGLLVGLLSQGRATNALLLLPAAALAWQAAGNRGAAVRQGAALVCAFAIVCAPGAIRNAAVSHEWIPFTYNAGINLYVGNNPIANGSFVAATGTHDIVDARAAGEDGGVEADGREYIAETTGLKLGPSASSAWWARRAFQWMRANPSGTAALWLRKLALAWSRHESPQIENVDEFRLLAGSPGLPWLGSFALLSVLGLAGMFIAWARGPQQRFVAGAVAVTTLALVPFFVTDRYRHHVVPGALVLAAIAADWLWRREWTRGVNFGPAAGAALGLALAFWPVPRLAPDRYSAGLASDVGMRWLERGRADMAEGELARAVDMDRRGEVRWLATSDDSLNRAVPYFHHARALQALGREADALAEFRRAAELAPGSRVIATALASALAANGDEAGAARLYARSGQPAGALAAAMDRGLALARAGDLSGADSVFSAVVAKDRSRFDAWGALVRIRAQAGASAKAREALDRARAAGWSGPAYDAHAALVLAIEGHASEARRLLASLPKDRLKSDPVLADVVRAVRQVLGE